MEKSMNTELQTFTDWVNDNIPLVVDELTNQYQLMYDKKLILPSVMDNHQILDYLIRGIILSSVNNGVETIQWSDDEE
jgi:hypothetical protein